MTTTDQDGTDGEQGLAKILGPVPPAMMVKHPGRQEIKPLPKRFYASAAAGPVTAEGFPILLDGRGAKTPKRSALRLPTPALAEAVTAEWQAQAERINPALMPLTRLANTAIDGVTGREADVRADIVKYAGSDLLCYRAERPDGLVQRQAELWDPILVWATSRLGCTFTTGRGLMPVTQPLATAAAVAAAIAHLDAFRLTSLHVMTTLMGSALLALAVSEGQFSAEAAWTAAHVDEDWQIAQWGGDAEAEVRRARRWAEMAAAGRMLALLDAPP